MTAHSQRAHAKLAPSASSRWMNCPGSIRLSEGIEDEGSIFANEGTAAHELCEHCLQTGFNPDRFAGNVIDIREKGVDQFRLIDTKITDSMHQFVVDDDMVDGVQLYLDYCRSIIEEGDEVDIEYRFDLTHVAPDMFGTGDLVVYKPEKRLLYVIDFKYGRGVPVDPEHNSQGLTYAVGAVRKHHNREIDKVVIAIVQPRCPHPKGPVREWPTDLATVVHHEKRLREAAVATLDDAAPLNPGTWCKFCPASATCPAQRDQALKAARMEFGGEPAKVTDMGPDELGETLDKVARVEDWCKRVREYAHAEAHAGRTPTGYKLVAGRAKRVFKDPEIVVPALRTMYGVEDSELFTEPTLRSPAQIEKLIPAKQRPELEFLIKKVGGATVLAPMDDARPAIRTDAAQEFGS